MVSVVVEKGDHGAPCREEYDDVPAAEKRRRQECVQKVGARPLSRGKRVGDAEAFVRKAPFARESWGCHVVIRLHLDTNSIFMTRKKGKQKETRLLMDSARSKEKRKVVVREQDASVRYQDIARNQAPRHYYNYSSAGGVLYPNGDKCRSPRRHRHPSVGPLYRLPPTTTSKSTASRR